ncbi:hypothetical protein T484DRAFT_1852451 [Baffinella frigidus]|nr:hypothetical protein T484DRAFT_1852451 [Cryptophyta sp. CCMP2293]
MARHQTVLDMAPAHADALCAMGELVSRVREGPVAAEATLAHHDKAVTTDRLASASADLLSRVREDPGAAEAHYLRALRADGAHVDALCSYAALLHHAPSREDEAADLKRRASRLAPGHPRVLQLP